MDFKNIAWKRRLDINYKKKKYYKYEKKTSRTHRNRQFLDSKQIHMESILNCSKYRAKRSGIFWELKYEDLKIPEYCPYLGIKLTHIMKQGRQQTNASLDRIDSTKGYTLDNIEIISDLANKMKQDATKEQLIAFAKGVLKKYENES